MLTQFGLTVNEAKTFLALSILGTATVKTISKASGIAREIVYQTMERLMKKGLIEEVVASPKAFTALPMEEAYRILLQHKKEENKELWAKAKQVLKKENMPKLTIDESQTTIIAPKGAKQSKISYGFENVQKSVDMIISAHKFIQWAQLVAEKNIDCILKKKVKMRLITEKQVQEKVLNSPQLCPPMLASKFKHVDFKFLTHNPSVEMVIFDKEIMFIATHKGKSIKEMIWLRSNNQSIIEMANSYFETIWNK